MRGYDSKMPSLDAALNVSRLFKILPSVNHLIHRVIHKVLLTSPSVSNLRTCIVADHYVRRETSDCAC